MAPRLLGRVGLLVGWGLTAGCSGEPSAPHDQQTQALTCGDGDLDFGQGEFCDTGTSASEACSTTCVVQNILVEPPEFSRVERYTGSSRHPSAVSIGGAAVAFLEVPEQLIPSGAAEVVEPIAEVRARLFERTGERSATVSLSDGLLAWYGTSAALAPLDDGGFAAVFEAFDVDGDELGLALRTITPDGEVGTVVVANETATADQTAPDVVRVGDDLIIAWTDNSNAGSAPDLRYRRFSQELAPLSGDQALAEGAALESSVALTTWGDNWAAVWRAAQLDGTEQLVVSAPERDLTWTISNLAPVSAEHRPSVVALDEETLLVAFAEGTMPSGHVLADVPRVFIAVLHEGNIGEVTPCDPLPNTGTFTEVSIGQGQPTLAVLENEALLGWVSSPVPSNAYGEELWQRPVTWPAGITSCSQLGYGGVASVPTGEDERAGDQRHLAFVADRGLLMATWEDYARTIDEAQGSPDLVLKLAPYETTCSTVDPCGEGEGHCESDEECEDGLTCGYRNGPAFGYPPNFNVCIPCGNGIVDPGEECDDATESPTCNANCTLSSCGDGFVNAMAGEQCDNGTTENSPSCNGNCTTPACGDGIVNEPAGEECEPATPGSNDADCDLDCTLPTCGDEILNPSAGETCEMSDPGCDLDCGLGTCPSDGCFRLESRLVTVAPTDSEMHPQIRLKNLSAQTVNLSQYTLRYWFTDSSSVPYDLAVVWDPAFVVEGSMGVVDVSPLRVNANRYVSVPLEGSIGPSGATVALEFSWRHQGFTPSFVETDDYSYLSTLSYTENTQITVYKNGTLVWGQEPAIQPICGNSIVESPEQCDTGGQSTTCDADCTLVICGDGTVNSSAGEVCDPASNPLCNSTCTGFTSCTNSAICLHAQYAHTNPDDPNDNSIRPRFKLVNNGTSPVQLSQVKIRYWFTKEPTSGTFQTWCDHATMGCTSIIKNVANGAWTPVKPTANYYWDIGFTSAAGTLNPGANTGEIVVRANVSTWANFNESNDYSYANILTYTPRTQIGVYINNVLVWGAVP